MDFQVAGYVHQATQAHQATSTQAHQATSTQAHQAAGSRSVWYALLAVCAFANSRIETGTHGVIRLLFMKSVM